MREKYRINERRGIREEVVPEGQRLLAKTVSSSLFVVSCSHLGVQNFTHRFPCSSRPNVSNDSSPLDSFGVFPDPRFPGRIGLMIACNIIKRIKSGLHNKVALWASGCTSRGQSMPKVIRSTWRRMLSRWVHNIFAGYLTYECIHYQYLPSYWWLFIYGFKWIVGWSRIWVGK